METKLPKGGFLNPEIIIEEIGVKKGMKIADFGCGAGFFTISLARIIGEEGRVYALDIVKTALESVQSKAKIEGLFNVVSIWSNLESLNGSKLEKESIDVALLAKILFQSSKKTDIIKEAKRILKKKGKMVIIEWKEKQPIGPPEKFVVSKELVQDLAKKQGFKFEKEFPAGENHWGMIFTK